MFPNGIPQKCMVYNGKPPIKMDDVGYEESNLTDIFSNGLVQPPTR